MKQISASLNLAFLLTMTKSKVGKIENINIQLSGRPITNQA